MNKLTLFLLVFLSGISFISAQNTIELEITNFKSNEGIAMIGLYDSKAGFMEDDFRGKKLEIKDKKITTTFENIPDGVYAISVFHDKNKDGKLNTNFLGIPKEDYGATNKAHSRLGAPLWEDAKFEVKNGETVKKSIRL
jgi:uncharacterized protein (DUF2141 family)